MAGRGLGGKGLRKQSKSRRKKKQVFKTYISRVLKNIHTDISINVDASITMDYIVEVIEAALLDKAFELKTMNGDKSLTSKHIKHAIFHICPGDLADHAFAEANRSISKYKESLK